MAAAFDLCDLEKLVLARAKSGDASSWTAKLFEQGIEGAAKKLGEEAVETVIAAVAKDGEGLVSESADLLYHLVVVLAISGVPLRDVMDELDRRTARSGIAEKTARGGT